MHTSCAMMALRVSPPDEEEGVEVERVEEAEGVTISVCACLRRS